MTKTYLFQILSVSLFLCLGTSSCRFTLPSAAEGAYLKDKGVFGATIPAWVNQSQASKPVSVAEGGYLPQTFGVSGDVALSRQSVPTSAGNLYEARRVAVASQSFGGSDSEERYVRRREANAAYEEKGAFNRILELCPLLEKDVVDALKTTNRLRRVKLYESLTQRCSESSDLWFWLGKDYREEKSYIPATRCFEKVLLLDPYHEKARALLAEVKGELNKPAKQ